MNIATRTLFRAGAEASLVEDFRALAEATAPDGAPRYRERPVLEALARFVVRRDGGPNRDAPFYELCHLANAVDAAGLNPDRRNAFFLGPEAASAARFQARFTQALNRGGWRRPGFQCDRDGVTITYPEGMFSVRYGRMPFLAALYEFLAGMDDFAFYGDLAGHLDEMTLRAPDIARIQAASNRIASHFRQYRRRHLAQARYEGKFDALYDFIAARSPDGALVIDDAGVLDFWTQASGSGDFRTYRTVFDTFATFLNVLDDAARSEALAQAVPIGVDREHGEIEPDDGAHDLAGQDEWVSPLKALDEEPASGIKFLKKEGERKPIETLMHYGPNAVRLPLAFLRLEAFGSVQSAITTDLQVGRGRESVTQRVSCGDAQAYGEIVTRFENILGLVRRLQKAAFYALHKGREGRHAGNVHVLAVSNGTVFEQARTLQEQDFEMPGAEALDRLAVDAAKAFKAIARKGFDEASIGDDASVRGFEIGAGALVAMAAQLERYLDAADAIGARSRDLAHWFDTDRETFSARFRVLYGVRP